MNMGMGLLPDDRKAEGIIADLSVRENIILAMQAKRGMFKQLSRAKQEEIADKYIDLLQIKTATRSFFAMILIIMHTSVFFNINL